MNSQFMNRCVELALRGSEKVAPNPLVGCVIVHNNRIIGEGFHQKYGESHAEVNAIHAIKDKELLRKSTLYVNLEPCAHHGKTPPCADLIIDMQIPRVVIANRDPFDAVNGKGIEKLRAAGIDVEIGVEEKAGEWLNRRFFTFHRKKRPYIILKFARSADGFIDKDRKSSEKGVNWITSPKTQYLTHGWRAEESAILVGTRTALIDNPALTVRRVKGTSPLRLLIDRRLKLPENAALFNTEAATVVFNEKESGAKDHITWVQLDFDQPLLPQIMEWCYQNQVQSVLVEGGAATLQQFIDAQLWDEARILTGQSVFHSGLQAPEVPGEVIENYYSGPDQVQIFVPKK